MKTKFDNVIPVRCRTGSLEIMKTKFDNIIPKLNTSTVHSIHDVMLNVCIAYYLEGQWRSVLALAKNKSNGSQRKVFEFLENSGEAGIERLAGSLVQEDYM